MLAPSRELDKRVANRDIDDRTDVRGRWTYFTIGGTGPLPNGVSLRDRNNELDRTVNDAVKRRSIACMSPPAQPRAIMHKLARGQQEIGTVS